MKSHVALTELEYIPHNELVNILAFVLSIRFGAIGTFPKRIPVQSDHKT